MMDDPTLNQDEIDALLNDIPDDGGAEATPDLPAEDLGDIGDLGDDLGDLGDIGGDDLGDIGGDDLGDIGGMDDLGGDAMGDELAGMMDEPAAEVPAPAAAAPAPAPSGDGVASTLASSYPQENIEVLLDVPLNVVVELGRSEMPIQSVLDLGPGSIVELNRMAGEPINILVNGKLVAKGEVVVVDENFGVKITNIISPMERLTQLN